MRRFVKAHSDALASFLTVGVLVFAVVLIVLFIVTMSDASARREAEQFVGQCREVLEVSAEKCHLLWGWRR